MTTIKCNRCGRFTKNEDLAVEIVETSYGYEYDEEFFCKNCCSEVEYKRHFEEKESI